MANELRVVFDANVFISALLLPSSMPRQAFDLALRAGKLLISKETLVELHTVLSRPKFERYVSAQQRDEFLTAVLRDAEVIEISQAITACRDPKDDMYLELSVNGAATHLVTGDDDLLILHPFRGIAIVQPKALVDLLSTRQS
jgi:uncharacterized protein